ncbi:carbohydrate kinase family protein [bacterium]|nr:carbohydrate kinase family protein [bacterium]
MTRAPRLDVIGFGFNTIDHVCVVDRPPLTDGKARARAYQQLPGGQVPTALVALQRWRLRTAYIGPFGDDAGGALQRRSLAAARVDLSGAVQRRGVASQTSVILVDAVTGERSILWHRPPELALRAGELDLSLIGSGRALLLDAADADTALLAAERAQASGMLVMLDVDEPGPRTGELLARSTVVIVGDGFPPRHTGIADLAAALRHMAAAGPRLVVATLGAGGALAWADGRSHYVPAVPVPVVDTTSAGDCYHAAALFGLLHGWTTPRTLRFAAAAAALACTRLGGRSSIPELGDVERLADRLA